MMIDSSEMHIIKYRGRHPTYPAIKIQLSITRTMINDSHLKQILDIG